MREKLNALTGIRFIAAAMIVFHHTAWMYSISNYVDVHIHTDYGVTFFYVLSGFILYYTHSHISGSQAIKRFIIARLARVWPLHLVTMILVMLLFSEPWGYPSEAYTWLKIGLNTIMLHAWIPEAKYFFSLNGPSWSVSVELFFYFCFPFLLLGFYRNWLFKLITAFCIGYLLMLYVDGLHLPTLNYGDPALGLTVWAPMAFPIGRLPEFILGMLSCKIWLKQRDAKNKLSINCNYIEVLALIVAIYTVAGLPSYAAGVAHGPVLKEWIMRMTAAPFFALFIYILADGKGLISKCLGNRYLVFLGEISFSMYMTHEILARVIVSYYPQILYKEESWKGFLLYWCINLIVSFLLWSTIEKPCRRSIMSFYDKKHQLKIRLKQRT